MLKALKQQKDEEKKKEDEKALKKKVKAIMQECSANNATTDSDDSTTPPAKDRKRNNKKAAKKSKEETIDLMSPAKPGSTPAAAGSAPWFQPFHNPWFQPFHNPWFQPLPGSNLSTTPAPDATAAAAAAAAATAAATADDDADKARVCAVLEKLKAMPAGATGDTKKLQWHNDLLKAMGANPESNLSAAQATLASHMAKQGGALAK